MFKLLDGETTGPGCFKGRIGKELNFDSKNLSMVNFKAINGNIVAPSAEVVSQLSKDQLYLLKAGLAVQQGSELANQDDMKFLQHAESGAMHHARWLTRANRNLFDVTWQKKIQVKS